MTTATKLTRRRMLQTALGLSPLSLGALTSCSNLHQAGKPIVRATDPIARALAYYPNSNDVPDDNPLAATHDVSQTCANCVHARDVAEEGLRMCPKFPQRRVNATGWCSEWAKS